MIRRKTLPDLENKYLGGVYGPGRKNLILGEENGVTRYRGTGGRIIGESSPGSEIRIEVSVGIDPPDVETEFLEVLIRPRAADEDISVVQVDSHPHGQAEHEIRRRA